ncbi:T9SS type A sorting domain-containing protein [Chryseobacterium jejuense]|uniref:T9SS type A sorting domain-containing protein n=1 Tax=Chryseobacterium jejuense TaxID=445960 RepID=UPI001AE42222|nr:T9SS type A sorting domain-containing protein [Chryseobacterium jejuense]MBP2616103.1 putative delta-60 repeat protein [Chryseobacterium jejuense]
MKKTFLFLFQLVATIVIHAQFIAIDENYTSVPLAISSGVSNNYDFTTDGVAYVSTTGNIINKYTPNGTLDSSFGINGSLASPLSGSKPQVKVTPNNLYIFSQNKIVKYSLDGILDTTFGTNGIVTFDLNDVISSIVVNTDSSLYVNVGGHLSSAKGIKKVLPTGSVDPLFLIAGNNVDFMSMSRTSSNEILTYCSEGPPFGSKVYSIRKYNTQGSLDTTFGNQGSLGASVFMLNDEINVDSNNNIYIFDENLFEHKIYKYTSNGVKDSGFGNNGTLSLSSNVIGIGGLSSMDIDENDKLVIFAGGIVRINSNGTLDNTLHNGQYYCLWAPAASFPPGAGSGSISTNYGKSLKNGEYIVELRKRINLSISEFKTFKLIRSNVNTLATDESSAELPNFQVYPNPVNDILHIKLESREKLQKVSIYSMDGKLIFLGTDAKMDLGTLSSGNYLVEIKTDKNVYTKKVIKK